MERVICNLCGSSETTPLYQIPDWQLDHFDDLFTLVKCNECGLIYQNPRPGPSEIDRYYPDIYEHYQPRIQNQPGQTLRTWMQDYGIRKRCRFVLAHRSEGKLLDIGCSSGAFLLGMQAFPNWKVYGVEKNAYAAQLARQQVGTDIYCGTIEKAHYPEQFFDVITLWDVLEHLHHPLQALEEINRILKPNGLLVLRLPNAASRDAALFGPFWAGLDPPRHLYVFTPQTLQHMLQKSGFAIDTVQSNIGNYPNFVTSLRFWMTSRKMDLRLRRMIVGFFNSPVLQVLNAPIFYMRSQKVKGSSIVVTATKEII